METVTAFYFEHPMWIWFAVGAVFLAVEVATGTGWLLWPAAAAGVVGLLSFILPEGYGADVAVFAALTIASALLARRFLPQGDAPPGDINDNISRLVGRQGVVRTAFSGGAGRVFVDGKEWAALAEAGVDPSPEQAVVVVAVVDGARLRVRAI